MKRILSMVALATVASVAGPIKVGADAMIGLNMPVVGSDMKNTDAKLGFGVAVGPTVTYAINDQFAIGAGSSFQLNTFGSESSMSFFGEEYKVEADLSVMSLGFQIAPSFQATEQLSLKVGYEWSMPLSGTIEVKAGEESDKSDIVWAPGDAKDLPEDESEFPIMSTHAIVVGGSYAVMPNLAVTLQGKFALNGVSPEYDEEDGKLKGAEESKDNLTVHQFALGVSYDFGI